MYRDSTEYTVSGGMSTVSLARMGCGCVGGGGVVGVHGKETSIRILLPVKVRTLVSLTKPSVSLGCAPLCLICLVALNRFDSSL